MDNWTPNKFTGAPAFGDMPWIETQFRDGSARTVPAGLAALLVWGDRQQDNDIVQFRPGRIEDVVEPLRAFDASTYSAAQFSS